MTVETTTRKTTQAMTILLEEFTFTFRALLSSPTDIKCIRQVTATGIDTDMEYVTDLPDTPTETDVLKFKVDINDDGVGGTVTVAWPSTSCTITIYRETSDVQSSDYEDYNQFPADTVENDFDKRSIITQELGEDKDRTLRIPITSTVSTVLPTPVADEYLGWNATATALVNKAISEAGTLVRADKAQAEAGTNNTAYMTPLRTTEAMAVPKVQTITTLTITTKATILLLEATTITASTAIIVAATITTLNVTNLNVAGTQVGFDYTQTGAMTTGTTAMPDDDSIPQNDEGDEYMTVTRTPKKATNKLKIEVKAQVSNNAGEVQTTALYQDAIADALAGIQTGVSASAEPYIATFTHIMTAGTTSLITFKMRSGCASGTTTFNGAAAGRKLGGVLPSSIVVTETAT